MVEFHTVKLGAVSSVAMLGDLNKSRSPEMIHPESDQTDDCHSNECTENFCEPGRPGRVNLFPEDRVLSTCRPLQESQTTRRPVPRKPSAAIVFLRYASRGAPQPHN